MIQGILDLLGETMLKLWFTLFFSLIVTLQAFGADENYYNDQRRGRVGYYGYEPVPPKDKPEEEKKEVKKEEDKNPQRKLPSMKDYTMEQLWNMHPDDFQALLEDFKKKAIMTLKTEDVKEYKIMEDIGRRKSLAFANVNMYVVQTTPMLNAIKDSPAITPGRNAEYLKREEDVEGRLRRAKDDFALLYFYSPNCKYCETQNGIMQYFIKKYDWEIKKINTDIETGLSARFGIETTPTLLLIYRHSKEHFPVAVGVISMDEMETNIYRGIRLLTGEITPEEYSVYDYQKGGTFDVKSLKRIGGVQ
jgi:conjugal transfer pilus assembly protein TraF